jgi:hypothetical protein
LRIIMRRTPPVERLHWVSCSKHSSIRIVNPGNGRFMQNRPFFMTDLNKYKTGT